MTEQCLYKRIQGPGIDDTQMPACQEPCTRTGNFQRCLKYQEIDRLRELQMYREVAPLFREMKQRSRQTQTA